MSVRRHTKDRSGCLSDREIEVIMKKLIHAGFVCLGFLFVGLGAVGVVLPLFPATPFLLLAAVCFAKGSDRFHRWFANTKLYLRYVEPAIHKKAMEGPAKRKAVLVLCLVFAVGFFLVPIWHGKAVILVVALFHFYYFAFKIKTLPGGGEGS